MSEFVDKLVKPMSRTIVLPDRLAIIHNDKVGASEKPVLTLTQIVNGQTLKQETGFQINLRDKQGRIAARFLYNPKCTHSWNGRLFFEADPELLTASIEPSIFEIEQSE